MSGRTVTKFRFSILALFFLVGYGAIGYRLVELHAIKAPELQAEVQSSRNRIITLPFRRGDILDANGELIATSQTFLEVGVDPKVATEKDLLRLPEVARALGLSLSEVEAAFGAKDGQFLRDPSLSETRWRLLKRRVEEKEYRALEAMGIRALYGSRDYLRVYPKNEFAAHIVGYVRQDGKAVEGIEREYDFYLSGQRGWKESEVGGREGELAQFRRRHVEAIDGMNIVLSIDSYVQHAVEKELEMIAETYNPQSASIIVSDPYTGYILGMANYPTFDPNRYTEFPIETHKNRALTDPLEPGSTFKIVAASAALEEGLVDVATPIDCRGDTIRMSNGYVARLPRDSHDHGVLSVAEVVAKSSNRGAAHLGVMLGANGFYNWVTRYGFGEKTGLGLGNESVGILNPPQKWDGLTLTRMPMGHAIAATPIQIHYAMATVANGGILMKPQIVSGIQGQDGEIVVNFGSLPRRRVLSRNTANTLRTLLEKVVQPGGTARNADIPGYRVAGKTGTSQKIVDGVYSHSEHVGSFTGFFPADDPEVVITVVVDGARLKGRLAYGGTVAAPSFRNIALKLIPRYAISPRPSAESVALGNKSPSGRNSSL